MEPVTNVIFPFVVKPSDDDFISVSPKNLQSSPFDVPRGKRSVAERMQLLEDENESLKRQLAGTGVAGETGINVPEIRHSARSGSELINLSIFRRSPEGSATQHQEENKQYPMNVALSSSMSGGI